MTHSIEDGTDPKFIQEQVGHRYVSTTAIYTSHEHHDAEGPGPHARHSWPVVIRHDGKLDYRWRLREVMATRGMFSTTDLRPLPAERGIDLSPSQTYRLVVERPDRLSLKALMALLDILGCTVEGVARAGHR
ncbi:MULTISPECIES: helix-turn-helix domain-containing protein [unclassified Streptomyces]|uniref:helix-turn-helix domain-containing protein n=1 Tax=unclassified Streptomyces TaxID=2593676 RepID=UPI00336A13B3